MGLGSGFLKQMNDTMKYNRDLLGKKKSVREIYKDEIKKRASTYDKEALESVRERVSLALKRNRTKELIGKIIAFAILSILILGTIWVFVIPDFKVKKKGRYEDKANLFNTVLYDMPDGTKLKTDYFVRGPKAAETYLKGGLKHQNSESYYETGEQFRSALYYYDTLLTDIYFYKTGDTILNFPSLASDSVYRLKILSKLEDKEIEFDFYDGKIIQGTYREKNIVSKTTANKMFVR